jgi:hypothetical protein
MNNNVVFNPKNYALGKLISDIENGDIALPDLQRPFVWEPIKVRDFIDSLYKGLPTGTIILWEIIEPGNIKRINPDGTREPRYLVIDGQQRLTSLYSIIYNKKVLNKNFNNVKLKISFNPILEKFEVWNAAIEKDAEWIPNISSIFENSSSFTFVKNYLDNLSIHKSIDSKIIDKVSKNIERLYSIKDYPFTVLELSSDLDPEEVSEIFVRINSKGKSLNQSDFILTLMAVYWDEGRKQLEKFCEESRKISNKVQSSFNIIKMEPNPEHLVRSIVGYAFNRGRLKYAYLILKGRDFENRSFSEELRKKNFEIFKNGQQKVIDLVNWHDYVKIIYSAGFVNSKMISSKTAFFVTYSFYLIGKDKGVEYKLLEKLIKKWFAFSILTQRYTGSPESQIEQDLIDLKREDFEEFIEKRIRLEFSENFWDTNLPEGLLVTSNTTSFAFLIYLAAQVYEDKKVLFSDIKLRDVLNPLLKPKKNLIDKHHIFPVNYLKNIGIKEIRDINQIANIIYLEYKDNIKISDLPPNEYWEILTKDLSYKEKLEILKEYDLPNEFLNMDYYTFLVERRKLMAKRIKKYFESLS